MKSLTNSRRATASIMSLARKMNRDERGSVIEKVLLTVIALGGIIALAAVVNSTAGKIKTQAQNAATSADGMAGTATPSYR